MSATEFFFWFVGHSVLKRWKRISRRRLPNSSRGIGTMRWSTPVYMPVFASPSSTCGRHACASRFGAQREQQIRQYLHGEKPWPQGVPGTHFIAAHALGREPPRSVEYRRVDITVVGVVLCGSDVVQRFGEDVREPLGIGTHFHLHLRAEYSGNSCSRRRQSWVIYPLPASDRMLKRTEPIDNDRDQR